MPQSMFGRPSQHLLPSHESLSPASASTSAVVPGSYTAPVAPLSFRDFRFNSIGKQPELLSRISLSRPEHTDYHSPTPSPTSPPLPLTNDTAFPLQSSSRPTLFQQLAGSNSSVVDGGSRTHTSTSQPNGSLASRIQMNVNSSNDLPKSTYAKITGSSSPPLHVDTSKRTAEHASLIPPVEVLPQLSDSLSPSPASVAQTLEPMNSPTSSALLMNTGTTRISRVPTPITTTNVVSSEQTESSPSTAAIGAMMWSLEPPPSAVPAIESLVAQQERLQAISASLTNLAPLPPSSSHSSSPDLSSVARASDNTTPRQSGQSQNSAIPIVLRDPYPANQSSSWMVSDFGDMFVDMNDSSSLSLVPSPTTLTQEHQQRRGFMEAAQNVNFALHALHRVQTESERALTHQLRVFEEQRAAFEQMKRAEAIRFQQESQELQQKREELDAKEADLALREKESKAREDARKAVIARRQVQEEEKRAAEAKKIQETQERIAAVIKEVVEVEAQTAAKRQFGQLASETAPDDLPTEPRGDMNEEEIVAIKSRNDLLCEVNRLRQLHMQKAQKLEEFNRTLRRLQEDRKKRQVEEEENRRIAEERLRAHAEAERARQVHDEKWRQLEAEKRRQAVEDGREQVQLSAEQQAHARAEAPAHGLRRPETASSQTSERRSYPEEAIGSQRQAIPDVTRIQTTCEANSRSSAATNTTRVDTNERASVSHLSAPSSVAHTSSRASQSTTPRSKQEMDGPVSGGIMLAPSITKARGGHLPPKLLLAKPSPLSPSNHVAESAINSPGPSPAVNSMSAEGFIRANNTSTDNSTLGHRPPFLRTPKSQTIMDATNGGSQELNIGPAAGVSPTQQNVNLRHLKRSRGRVEENDSGDRSVRMINVKCEETSIPSLKQEEDDDRLREPVSASLSTDLPAPLPPRLAVISPPRPWLTKKRQAVPASHMDSTSSCPPRSNELSSTREAGVTTDEQPRGTQSRVPSSLAMDAPVQLPVLAEADSLLLRSMHPGIQTAESRISAGERPAQDCNQNHDSATSDFTTATLSHELDGQDPSRNGKRSTEEHREAHNENSFCHLSDRYSSSLVALRPTPTQPHRSIDSWWPQNTSYGPRAELMRATSPPTAGRKRPSEFSDSEHGHRARRHRPGYGWTAQDQDRSRVDSYRPHWDRDRRFDSEHDERRITYHAPSPPDRMRPYSSDISRATYDNRTYVSPSEESTALPARREQPYRRQETDDAYQRYQPPAPDYHAMTDQHHADDPRVGQTYEPMAEESIEPQPDPSLLARISTTQRFSAPTNLRGRGRGESSRGRSDSGRGRGRGNPTRGGPPLIERLQNGPSSGLGDRSLGDRLT